jgi:hypothetical protein
MCGVGKTFVESMRPDVATDATSPATRLDTLGRQQPAKRTAAEIKHTVEPVEPEAPAPEINNDVRKVKRGKPFGW